MVVMRDPDTGWINYGAYRVQAHERNVATVMLLEGQAWRPHQSAAITSAASRVRFAVVCGMPSGLVHDRRPRNSLRQE